MDLRVWVYSYGLWVSGMDLKVQGFVLWIMGLGFGFKEFEKIIGLAVQGLELELVLMVGDQGFEICI